MTVWRSAPGGAHLSISHQASSTLPVLPSPCMSVPYVTASLPHPPAASMVYIRSYARSVSPHWQQAWIAALNTFPED